MHFNFDFSTGQILWTLTFAALLVLLVVLLGRDRARRFPWFTASMVMMACASWPAACCITASPAVLHRGSFLCWPIWPRSSPCSSWSRLRGAHLRARSAKCGSRERWLCWRSAEWCWPCGARGPRARRSLPPRSFRRLRLMQSLRAESRSARRYAHHPAWPARGALRPLLQGGLAQPHAADRHRPLHRVACAVGDARHLAAIATHITIHSQDEYKRVMGMMNKLNNANSVIFHCRAGVVDYLPVDRRAGNGNTGNSGTADQWISENSV